MNNKVFEDVAKITFERKLDEVKDDIESGRITFYNPPSIWTEEMLRATALSVNLLMIAKASKWN